MCHSELSEFLAELTGFAAELSEFSSLFRNSTPETVFLPLPKLNTFISATDPPLFLGVDACRDPGEGQF